MFCFWGLFIWCLVLSCCPRLGFLMFWCSFSCSRGVYRLTTFVSRFLSRKLSISHCEPNPKIHGETCPWKLNSIGKAHHHKKSFLSQRRRVKTSEADPNAQSLLKKRLPSASSSLRGQSLASCGTGGRVDRRLGLKMISDLSGRMQRHCNIWSILVLRSVRKMTKPK